MEQQYLNELKSILQQPSRQTRNAVTRSQFGCTLEAENVSEAFPLFTTKRVFWKGVVEELLWFLRGQTDATLLASKGVHIWDGNSSREFLDKCGFTSREVGDCGPVYGFQWRHWGAKYVDCKTKYKGQGVDQLRNCIQALLTDKYSRRILLSGYNVSQLSEMVLPPCHVSYQFYVTGDDQLNCFMYQRSADMFLGAPFNVASTALLTTILAHYTSLKAGTVRLNICDAHIYEAHVHAVEEQVKRCPGFLPTVKILDDVPESVDEILERIENLTLDKIQLLDYKPQSAIKAEMIA